MRSERNTNHRRRSVAVGIGLLLLSACASLDLSRQTVDERIRMHAGTRWEMSKSSFGVCASMHGTEAREPEAENTPDVMRFFTGPADAKNSGIRGREIFITNGQLRIGDGESIRSIQLHKVQEQLNCFDPVSEKYSRCPSTNASQDSKVGELASTMCLREPGFVGGLKPNFVAIDSGTCIAVALATERGKDGSPTDISRDRLHIVACGPGPKGPGAVVGGPRVRY